MHHEDVHTEELNQNVPNNPSKSSSDWGIILGGYFFAISMGLVGLVRLEALKIGDSYIGIPLGLLGIIPAIYIMTKCNFPKAKLHGIVLLVFTIVMTIALGILSAMHLFPFSWATYSVVLLTILLLGGLFLCELFTDMYER